MYKKIALTIMVLVGISVLSDAVLAATLPVAPDNGTNPVVGLCRNDTDCPLNYICENSACVARPRSPNPGGNTGSGGNTSQAPGRDLTIQDVFNVIVALTCWLTRIAIFLIVIFLLYYGFLFMKAQGDPGKVTDAKKAFLWGIVGIIVILGTYSIIATVAYTVGGTAARINPIPISCSGVR